MRGHGGKQGHSPDLHGSKPQGTFKEISALMDSEHHLGTSEDDHLDILPTPVHACEAKHIPTTLPNPVEAIRFRLDQSGPSA